MVELGQVDVITEVSTLASYLASPREGHLEAAVHLYAYIKGKHNSHLVFDPTYPDMNHNQILFGTYVEILSTEKGTFLCLLGIDKMKLKIPKLYYLSELCKQKQKFYKKFLIYLFHAYLLHE